MEDRATTPQDAANGRGAGLASRQEPSGRAAAKAARAGVKGASGVGAPEVTGVAAGGWHGRAVLLLDLDAFFASVEQMDHPEWRGKPVIVGGSADKRGVVATASYEARAFGVHSAMASAQARRLCPDAVWTHGRFSRYREVSDEVMGLMLEESPFLEQVSIDEAFLDVSPTRVNREDPVSVAQRLQRRVRQIGITCSIGLGVSKAVAKTASEQEKPRGLTVVYPGTEAQFLAPLPIARMSGIGPASQEALRRYGITTLGQVANADEDVLRRVFGANAAMMRARCSGQDVDTVVDDTPTKSVSNEISFAHDIDGRADVEAALSTVCAKVARRLRKNGLVASRVALKVRYADLTVRSARARLSAPGADEFEMAHAASSLLPRLWSPGTPLRLVGVAAGGLSPADAPVQQALFDVAGMEEDGAGQGAESPGAGPHTTGRKGALDAMARESLAKATDEVRDRFGEDAVQFGGALRTKRNLTGSASKNPADYKKAKKG